MKLPELTKVESSNIQALGWSPGTGLVVRFKGGGTYRYPEVPEKEYTAGVKEESVGSWFAKSIRGQYRHILHDE